MQLKDKKHYTFLLGKSTEEKLSNFIEYIDKEGITPDYDVNIGDSYLNSPTKENDMQLKKALDLLK